MIYVTVKTKLKQNEPQITTFEELLKGLPQRPSQTITTTNNTATFLMNPTDKNYRNLVARYSIKDMRKWIYKMEKLYKHLLIPDMQEHYKTFYIPKKTGGMRRIDAPEEELKAALTTIKFGFESQLFTLHHNSAHAYVRDRSTVTDMQVHQLNQSRWFLKIDMKDFFPSHDLDFIIEQLKYQFPFYELFKSDKTLNSFKILMQLGLLNNRLPQGSPLSPLLTNLTMIPIDYRIQQTCYRAPSRGTIYTRYADDLLVSSPYKFHHLKLLKELTMILDDTPLRINNKKTRYGSSAGRNWNLGIMLNKDNKLTIGHKANQRFRAAIFNFMTDSTKGRKWSITDCQVLQGQISYYHSIQPEYVDKVLNTYSKKFKLDVKTHIIHVMNNNLQI